MDYNGIFGRRFCLGPGKYFPVSFFSYFFQFIINLTHFQMKAGFFEEPFIATILREILKGLEYLHNERKLHRDVKGMDKMLRI